MHLIAFIAEPSHDNRAQGACRDFGVAGKFRLAARRFRQFGKMVPERIELDAGTVERGKGKSRGCDIMRAIARRAQPLEIIRRRLARCAHVPDCRPPKYRPGSSFKTT